MQLELWRLITMPFSLIIKDGGGNRKINWAQVFENKMYVLDP